VEIFADVTTALKTGRCSALHYCLSKNRAAKVAKDSPNEEIAGNDDGIRSNGNCGSKNTSPARSPFD
jgi:hypothetical protein